MMIVVMTLVGFFSAFQAECSLVECPKINAFEDGSINFEIESVDYYNQPLTVRVSTCLPSGTCNEGVQAEMACIESHCFDLQEAISITQQ